MEDQTINQTNTTTENTQDFYADENKEIIDNLKVQHQKELAERDAKYSALLKAYTSGDNLASADAPIELTPEEKVQLHNDNCVSCINDHMSSIEMARKMMDVRNYVKESQGKDIFCGDVTPSEADAEKAQQCADYIQYALDNCEGDNEVFTTLIGSHLVEVLKK